MIDTSNVATLKQVWSITLPNIDGTPVISNGILYATSAKPTSKYGQYVGSIYAMSESTGKLIWQDGPGAQTGLSFSTIAGIAIDNGNVFAATAGNNLVSLNAGTGALNWRVPLSSGLVENPQATYIGPQGTPLVWNGEIIISDVGGNSLERGFVRAFSESNGALLWTFYTVPPSPMTSTNQGFYKNTWGACTYCGGGDNWNVPAIDPHTGIIYFGTGNPFPYFNASERAPGPGYLNLYANSVIALNATSGQMVWYYQEVAGDTHDWDAGMPVQLFTTSINGTQREVVGSGGKNGYYYLLDAATGALIYSTSLGIHRNASQAPTPQGEITYPGSTGGINTYYTYDPMTNSVYTTVFNYPTNFVSGPIGLAAPAGSDNDVPGIPLNSTLYALNASTGAINWSVNLRGLAGGVSSSNNLVFTADAQGNYYAFNAQTGSVLWNYTSGKSSSFLANWGPPSVTDGLLFETSFTANGGVMAFAPSTVTTTITQTTTVTSPTTTTVTTTLPATTTAVTSTTTLPAITVTTTTTQTTTQTTTVTAPATTTVTSTATTTTTIPTTTTLTATATTTITSTSTSIVTSVITSTTTSTITTSQSSTSTTTTTSTSTTTTSTSSSSTGIALNGIQATSGTVSSPYQITLPNFNAGVGTNRLLVVGVEANNNDVVSITFGGVPLAQKAHSFFNNDADFWYLTNPSGAANIVVTMSGATSVVVGAYSFSGVDQANPIPTTASSHNTVASSPTISITTAFPNGWVLDSPSIWGGVTLGSPTCTQSWDIRVPSAVTGASSSKIASSPGTVTCGWTASSADSWDDVAIEIKASP